jgi:hypothetical protein
MAVQKICPVTGEAPGSMGEPVKIQVGKQIAYLCCRDCLGQQLDATHWKTIQANIAAAQGNCPIIGKAVTADMKSTVVNGQLIFVCCPPCIAKIQADPAAASTKVNASYVSSVAGECQARSEQLHIVAQGICPVSGEKPGSMGAPVNVRFGENEIAFLCCRSCIGKQINAEHWAAIQVNLANAQGSCPVLGKPVDASMTSTVVNGRRIFVCCPSCIDKINSEPDAFLAKLDFQVATNIQAGQQPAGDSH